MTNRTARITINSEMISPAKAITAAARSGPLLVISGRAFDDLCAELGGLEGAMRHLLRVAENVGKPIGVNFPTPEGSRTCFLAPKNWTQERLRGWVGARHEEIVDAFGPAVPLLREEL